MAETIFSENKVPDSKFLNKLYRVTGLDHVPLYYNLQPKFLTPDFVGLGFLENFPENVWQQCFQNKSTKSDQGLKGCGLKGWGLKGCGLKGWVLEGWGLKGWCFKGCGLEGWGFKGLSQRFEIVNTDRCIQMVDH